LPLCFGDGRDTGMGAQSIVISFGKSSAGLGDDYGGYDSPDSRQRAEDRNVAVLPWLVVLLIRRLKLVEQSFDAGTTTLALAVDQAQARFCPPFVGREAVCYPNPAGVQFGSRRVQRACLHLLQNRFFNTALRISTG
jgi:hypothetical protein